MRLNSFCTLIEWIGLIFAFGCVYGQDAAGGCLGLLLAIYAHLKKEPSP